MRELFSTTPRGFLAKLSLMLAHGVVDARSLEHYSCLVDEPRGIGKAAASRRPDHRAVRGPPKGVQHGPERGRLRIRGGGRDGLNTTGTVSTDFPRLDR